MQDHTNQFLQFLQRLGDDTLEALWSAVNQERKARFQKKIECGSFPIPNAEELNGMLQNKIAAIKAFQNRTGLGLWESKCILDYHRDNLDRAIFRREQF